MATTDSPKLMSPPNSGRHSASTMVDPASTEHVARARPVPSASSPTPTIRAARSTFGFGPASCR